MLPEDVMEALQTSNRAFWASDCIPMCKMRLQSEAARSIPTNRSCRFCDPVSGRCRGLCVRPCSPKSGRETLRRLPDYELRTGTRKADNVSVVRQEVQNVSNPPRNFTHRILGENPQLAARVAVQFQNSEASLLQSPLIPAAHGPTIWYPRSVGNVSSDRLLAATRPIETRCA